MGQRKEVSSAAGFTLLELLVTLLVLAIVVGLTIPTISRSSEAIRARADVAGFSAVLRHARERAITNRKPHAVVIDPVAHRMTVLAGGPEGEVRETRTLSSRLTVQAAPAALTVRFEPQGSSSGAEFRLTSGPVAYKVTVNPLTGRVKSIRE